jgi:hypothetical protein
MKILTLTAQELVDGEHLILAESQNDLHVYMVEFVKI